MKKKRIIKNNSGVSHLLEFMIAFGIIIVSLGLVYIAANNIFVPYEKDDFILRAKAISLTDRLIKDVGMTSDGDTNWEHDPSKLTVLGLASHVVINDTWYQTPPLIPDYVETSSIFKDKCTYLGTIENFTITNYSYIIDYFSQPVRIKYMISNRTDYGTLDSDKLYSLNNVLYNDAKNALGLEVQYDFNIQIVDVNGVERLRYGKTFDFADLVKSYSRNVRIYDSYSTSYEEAEITVYVF